MAELQIINNTPVQQPASTNTEPSEPVTPITMAEIPMDSPDMHGMVRESVLNYLDVSLKAAKLPMTKENIDKVLLNLTDRIHQQLVVGDFAIRDLDSKQVANMFFEQTCARLGLKNTPDSWKHILKRIGQ